MAIEIKKTDTLGLRGISALIYADSGVGKTTLLGTLPGRTLVIDVEGGTTTLAEKSIDYVTIGENLLNLKEVFDFIQQPDLPYDNVCLDSATELEKFMLIFFAKHNAKNEGVPQLADYQKAQFKMREYLRVMRDLRERGINTVITALEMPLKLDEGDGVLRTKAYPMMMNKLAPEACGLFDIVGHMEVSHKEGTQGQRFIRLSATEKVVAKDRIFKERTYCAADGVSLLTNNKPTEKKDSKNESQ